MCFHIAHEQVIIIMTHLIMVAQCTRHTRKQGPYRGKLIDYLKGLVQAEVAV